MLHVLLHPSAEKELEAAALHYEGCCENLGDDFLNEYEATLSLIVQFPTRFRKFHNENRKTKFRRFPYAIVYTFDADTIYVKAIMHLHRQPFYWQKRELR